MKTGPLGKLVALGCIMTWGCTRLTEPPSASSTPAPKPAETAVAKPATPTPPAPAAVPPAETAGAAHVLVAYAGSMRADPSIKRTKAEAQKRASDIQARAKKGEDFGKIADETSDDPSAKRNHGDLGNFTREQMVKPF